MALKIPIRAEYTGEDTTGLAEYQSGEVISVLYGGTGIDTVSPNGVVVGNDVNTLTQVMLPDGYILIGSDGDTLAATNILDCGRVTD